MMGDIVPLRPVSGGEVHVLAFDPAGKPDSVLKGHATLHLPKIRLKLFGCACFSSVTSGDSWVLPPSRALIDRDGNVRRDANGKAVFAPMMEWDSRDIQAAFSSAAVAALDHYDSSWRTRG
jgi:hypothetical protein